MPFFKKDFTLTKPTIFLLQGLRMHLWPHLLPLFAFFTLRKPRTPWCSLKMPTSSGLLYFCGLCLEQWESGSQSSKRYAGHARVCGEKCLWGDTGRGLEEAGRAAKPHGRSDPCEEEKEGRWGRTSLETRCRAKKHVAGSVVEPSSPGCPSDGSFISVALPHSVTGKQWWTSEEQMGIGPLHLQQPSKIWGGHSHGPRRLALSFSRCFCTSFSFCSHFPLVWSSLTTPSK